MPQITLFSFKPLRIALEKEKKLSKKCYTGDTPIFMKYIIIIDSITKSLPRPTACKIISQVFLLETTSVPWEFNFQQFKQRKSIYIDNQNISEDKLKSYNDFQLCITNVE